MAARRRRKSARQDAIDQEFEDIEAHSYFLDLVADGVPEVNAALEVGWTPRKMHVYLQDKSFAEMVMAARDRADGTIEKVLFDKAKAGQPWAVQMWLHNRKAARWQPGTQRIEVTNTKVGNAEMVGAVKEGVLAVLQAVGAKEMRSLPAVIEATSWEDTDGSDPD